MQKQNDMYSKVTYLSYEIFTGMKQAAGDPFFKCICFCTVDVSGSVKIFTRSNT